MAELSHPNWLVVKLLLKEAEFVKPIQGLIAPLRRRILELPEVRWVSYSWDRGTQAFYLSVDPATGDSDRVALKSHIEELCTDPSLLRWLKDAEVAQYRSLSTEVLGGPAFLPLFSQIHHILSHKTLELFTIARRESSASLVLFALVGTVAILDALKLSKSERSETCQAGIRQLGEWTKFEPQPLNQAIADCFPEFTVNWLTAKSLLKKKEFKLCQETYDLIIDTCREFQRVDAAKWTLPVTEVVSRRLVHLHWLRVHGDNYKEAICLDWLCKS